MKSKPFYVFDTNVIISALLFPVSVPRQSFDKASMNGQILLSQPVIDEIEDVIHRPSLDKYIDDDDRFHFVTAMIHDSRFVEVNVSIDDCRDPKDNKYLELAVAGQADCIVTGDKDLLVLNPFRNIPILTPRQFFDVQSGA